MIKSKDETIRALVISNEQTVKSNEQTVKSNAQTVKSNEQTIKYADNIIHKLNLDLVNANAHVGSLMGRLTSYRGHGGRIDRKGAESQGRI